jgi:PAS domain S-box/PAS domain S-box
MHGEMSHFARVLRNRLLSVAVVAMAPVALLSLLAVWNLAERVDRLCQDEALLYAQTIRMRWPTLARTADLPPVEALGLPPGTRLWLVRGDGSVLGPAPLPWPPETAPREPLTGLVEGAPFAAVPLDDDGARLVLGLTPERRDQRMQAMLGEIAALLAAAVALALGLAWAGIHRLVLSRLSMLEQAAERIRIGEVGVRTGLTGDAGELGRLGRTFDDMANAIDQRAANLQRSLNASESRFRQMARVVPTGIFQVDSAFRLTYVNPWCAELMGRSEAELLASGLLAFLHPDDLGWVSDAIDCAQARGVELEMRECRIRRLDGQLLWVQIRDTLELDSLGRIVGRIGTIMNVTAQKRITEALRESEERFRKLARIAPVGIYRTSPRGTFTYANDTLGTILGRPKYELKGCNWREFLPPGQIEPLGGLTGEQGRGEVRLVRPDGREVWVLVREVVESDVYGLPVGRIGTMSDITGQILDREALRISEERFQVALKHSPVTVFAFGTDLRCTWIFNGPAHMIGKRDDDILPPAEAAQMMRLKREVMESRCGRREEATYTMGGRQRILDMWFEPLMDENGQILGVVGAAVDITDSRRLQADLIAAREDAERANDTKSRFLAAASHDLRQPFQAMRLFRAALTPFLTDPRAETVAGKLDEAMTAGEQLLKALLDVSTLEAGIVAAKPSDFCAGAMIERLGHEFQPQAEAQGLSMRFHPYAARVRSDPVLLERMLRNLLHNAVRYTKQGGILIGARRRGDHLMFQVWDTGIGIAPDHQAKVFEDFYQVGNPGRDRSRGLGLGLSVVARMARLLEHQVVLKSRPSRGTVFSVSVPLAKERAEVEAA